MRKAYLTLAIATCMASSLALAQTRDTPASSTAVASTAQSQTTDAAPDRASAPKMPKSTFGQAMAVLTHLLQEAAAKQAEGRQPDASLPDLSNSALTITVTPIAGQTTFAPVAADNSDKGATAPVDNGSSTAAKIESTQLAVEGDDGAG